MFMSTISSAWSKVVQSINDMSSERLCMPLTKSSAAWKPAMSLIHQPASLKKMRKGDAAWATWKVILGWTIGTLAMKIEPAAHHIQRLFELLDSVAPHHKRVSFTTWEKIMGELRSMVRAIPGGKGLFSILQEVLTNKCDGNNRIRLTIPVHAVPRDFRWLASDLEWLTTRITEVIPTRQPATLGAHDVAALGMGGVQFIPLPDGSIQPLLWRPPSHLTSLTRWLPLPTPRAP
jgi:hypothetical protein